MGCCSSRKKVILDSNDNNVEQAFKFDDGCDDNDVASCIVDVVVDNVEEEIIDSDEYLISGYIRMYNNYHNIPSEIIKLILLIFSDNTFYWYLDKNIIHKLSKTNSEHNAIKSKTFRINEMNDILCNGFLYVDEEKYIQFGIKIINNTYKFNKSFKYELRFYTELFCNEINCNFKFAKQITDDPPDPSFYRYGGWAPSPSLHEIERKNKAEQWWNKKNMKLSDIENLNKVSFGCFVDILKIEKIAIDNKKNKKNIVEYIKYNKNKFISNTKYQWNLPNHIIQFIECKEYINYMRYFYSSTFGNGCWCLFIAPYQCRLDDRIAIGFAQLCHHNHGQIYFSINTNIIQIVTENTWNDKYDHGKLCYSSFMSFDNLQNLSWISIKIYTNNKQ